MRDAQGLCICCAVIETLDQFRRDCLAIASMLADGEPDKTKWEHYAAILQTVIVQMQAKN